MKKLFRVTVETDLIVWAEDNEKDIIDITQQSLRDHVGDINETEISYQELISLKQLPAPWDGRCLPYVGYRDSDDRTIADILEEKNA